MSDERDETRRQAPFDGADDQTRRMPRAEDQTRIVPSGADDATTIASPPGSEPGRGPGREPDSTAVMPPARDRADELWSGRAAVRGPRPGTSTYEQQDDWAAPTVRQSRDRWWMPILVGIILLILLGLLGWGIYIIVQNSGGNDEPAVTTSSAASVSASASASASPSSEPATTQATTEPTGAIPIPALKGLAVDDAKNALKAQNLRYRLIYQPSDSPAGTVIDSDPAEGQEVPPDTTVTLVVASAPTSSPTPSASVTPSASPSVSTSTSAAATAGTGN